MVLCLWIISRHRSGNYVFYTKLSCTLECCAQVSMERKRYAEGQRVFSTCYLFFHHRPHCIRDPVCNGTLSSAGRSIFLLDDHCRYGRFLFLWSAILVFQVETPLRRVANCGRKENTQVHFSKEITLLKHRANNVRCFFCALCVLPLRLLQRNLRINRYPLSLQCFLSQFRPHLLSFPYFPPFFSPLLL
ncbi:MAG: hypothetical protein BMS9Abin13_065 [Patescibacteria group bacterium]|nr:MAG: hypothetical protein BMS9Abin13_065 [Patescibacteria group bacterium]